MLEALRNRDFRLLWFARLTSQFGSWLLVIAVPVHVYELTGSLLASGLTMAAEFLPVLLFGPVAGVLSDRWDRRRIMIAMELYRAAAIALLLCVRSVESVWIVYVALAAESTGSILFRPAAQAHTSAVVGTGTALSSANSLNALADAVFRLAGAPAGAALMVWVGFTGVVVLDMASYLISTCVLALMSRQHDRQAGPRTTARRVMAELREGWNALRHQPVAAALLPITMVFLTANAALTAVLVPHGLTNWGGERAVGLVMSALGAGFLAGAPLIRVLVDRVQPRQLMAGGLAVTSVAYYALFVSSSAPAAMAAASVVGVAGSVVLVTPQTSLQRAIPNEVLGRVSAVFFSGEALATLLGAVAGPAMAEDTGVRWLMYAACVATLVTMVLSLLTMPRLASVAPSVRREGATEANRE